MYYALDSRPATRSKDPICTGTSVIGLKFDKGIVIAADTMLSYGKFSRYKGVSRLFKINDRTVLGMGGDFADYQFVRTLIENRESQMRSFEPPGQFNGHSLHSWLRSVLYYRRSRLNPLWNSFIVAGIIGDKNEPFLGAVSMHGVAYNNDFVATGLGTYIVQQLFENALKDRKDGNIQLNREQAVDLVRRAIEVLYERDCCAYNEYEYAVLDGEGCTLSSPAKVLGTWDHANAVRGYE